MVVRSDTLEKREEASVSELMLKLRKNLHGLE